MAIDRGNVKPGASVERDGDGLKAIVQGITNGVVQLKPAGNGLPAVHRYQQSAKPRGGHGSAYAHTAQLTVPLDEFLNSWSSQGAKTCTHRGIIVHKPTPCPYCGATVQPEVPRNRFTRISEEE